MCEIYALYSTFILFCHILKKQKWLLFNTTSDSDDATGDDSQVSKISI